MKRALLAGFICALLSSLFVLADGINIPFSFPATTCSNQFIRTIAASTGVGTCAAVATADITDANVTNAKLANMANSTIKCRTTAGTAAPEDCTAAQAASIVNLGNSFGTPYFKVTLTGGSQSVTSATQTKVAFDTTALDSNSAWSGANKNYNPQVAGTYLFVGQMTATGTFTVGTDTTCNISKNGLVGSGGTSLAQGLQNEPTGAGGSSCNVSTIVAMNGSTDTVELDVFIVATSSGVLSAVGIPTYFYGYRIGP